jgi:hypothetical protein
LRGNFSPIEEGKGGQPLNRPPVVDKIAVQVGRVREAAVVPRKADGWVITALSDLDRFFSLSDT